MKNRYSSFFAVSLDLPLFPRVQRGRMLRMAVAAQRHSKSYLCRMFGAMRDDSSEEEGGWQEIA